MSRLAAVIGLATAVLLAGCAGDVAPESSAEISSAAAVTTTTPRPTTRTITPTSRATPTPEPTTSATPDGPPEECLRSASDLSDTGPIGTAVAGVEVPSDVSLAMGTQVVPSHSDYPGMIDVVVRPCSSGLTDEELIDIGIAIARAIYPLAETENLKELHLSSWVPDPANKPYTKQDTQAEVTSYQSVLWDSDGPAVRSSWDIKH